MLDNIFTIAFLLLALFSLRDDDKYVLAGILCRGVKGDASLYRFPVTLGFSCCEKHAFFRVASFPFEYPLVMKAALTSPTDVFCASLYMWADQLVFVFNVVQPPSAVKPCILEACEDKSFDFPNCL